MQSLYCKREGRSSMSAVFVTGLSSAAHFCCHLAAVPHSFHSRSAHTGSIEHEKEFADMCISK